MPKPVGPSHGSHGTHSPKVNPSRELLSGADATGEVAEGSFANTNRLASYRAPRLSAKRVSKSHHKGSDDVAKVAHRVLPRSR